jgi:hypothetical protein
MAGHLGQLVMTGKLTIDVLNFKPLVSGTLRGFVDIRLRELRMIIRDVTVHQRDGKTWAGLPGKPMIDRNGNALRGDDGRIKYTPVLELDDKATRSAFSARVCAALEAHSPHAFEGTAA